MYPRSSSIELLDTPPIYQGEQNEITTATSIGCIFYTQRILYDLKHIKSRIFPTIYFLVFFKSAGEIIIIDK